jgi:tetratricopeptide (TPR) repeat protein
MTQNAPRRTPSRPPIRGTWEEVLSRANQLATSGKEEAIPLYQKLVDSLAQLPVRRRTAADNYLQKLLGRAASNFQQALAGNRRYSQAAALAERMQDLTLDDDERYGWTFDSGKGHFLAGDPDRAFAIWQTAAEQGQGEVLDWGYIAGRYMDLGRWDEARAVADRMENYIDQGGDPDDVVFDQAFIAGIYVELATRREQWDEAVMWAKKAAEIDPEQRYYFANIYIAMVWAGDYDGALQVLDHETSAVRTGLWKGLCQRKQGNENAAQRIWQQVAGMKTADLEPQDKADWAVVHYYLGDAKMQGLSIAMELVQEHHAIYHLILAALGWALRNNMKNALVDLEHALRHQRAYLYDDLLPNRAWHLFRDLLDDERWEQVHHFFKAPA